MVVCLAIAFSLFLFRAGKFLSRALNIWQKILIFREICIEKVKKSRLHMYIMGEIPPFYSNSNLEWKIQRIIFSTPIS